MKNFNIILIALSSLLVISCTKDDIQNTNRENVAQTAAPVLLNPTSAFNIVLDKAKETDLATSFVWNDAGYSGTSTVVTYAIEIAKKGTNFASPKIITTTTNRYKDVTVGELNSAILNAGLAPFIEHQIDVRIKSYVGSLPTSGTQYSNVFTIKATPYPSWPNWGIIGSATPTGWGSDTNLDYDLSTQLYSITINLTAGNEFKFRLDDAWSTNFGDDGNNLTLEPNGANIPVPATGTGDYKITVNFAANTYTIVKL